MRKVGEGGVGRAGAEISTRGGMRGGGGEREGGECVGQEKEEESHCGMESGLGARCLDGHSTCLGGMPLQSALRLTTTLSWSWYEVWAQPPPENTIT